jgi:hypothetical protein
MRVSAGIFTIVVGAATSLGLLSLVFAQMTYNCPEQENACSYSKTTWACWGNCNISCTGANDQYTGAKVYGLESPGAFTNAFQSWVVCHYKSNCSTSSPQPSQTCLADGGDYYCRNSSPSNYCTYCDAFEPSMPYTQWTWTCTSSGG